LTAPVLELRGVHAGYGRAGILEDVSMSVGVGECVALLGRNGAGKSTLCGSIYGIAQITAGVVEIEGRRLDGRHLFQAAQLGVALVPQGRRILSNLTVRENLLLGAAPRRIGPWNLDSVFQLFPVLAADYLERLQPTDWQLRAATRRAAIEEYFNRYFLFGLPADDIADATVREALTAIARDEQSPARAKVEAQLAGDSSFTYGRLHALAQARASKADVRYRNAWAGFPEPRIARWSAV